MKKTLSWNELWSILTWKERASMNVMFMAMGAVIGVMFGSFIAFIIGIKEPPTALISALMLAFMVIVIAYEMISEPRWKLDGRMKKKFEEIHE